jgi:hypothetical protein
MEPGTLHRHATEMNVLMALFGKAWESGLKVVRERDNQSLPSPACVRGIDFADLSRKLTTVLESLEEKIADVEALADDATATTIESQFAEVLLSYCRAFGRTVEVLKGIYVGLQARATAPDQYSQPSYERDLAAFREAARQHKAAGAAVEGLYEDLGRNDYERQDDERRYRRVSVTAAKSRPTNRDNIKRLAQSVGAELAAYIDVHNRIFKQASTLTSVFKNLFGRGVPMEQLLADTERLLPSVASVRAEVSAFRESSASSLGADERRYVDLLAGYAQALEQTVQALLARQQLLAQGSQGGRKNPMTWEAFQTANREYEKSIEVYKRIGLDLNNAAPTVFR